jgi:putative acetyltransferase
MHVTQEDFDQSEVRELLHLADSYTASLYPPEGRTPFAVADVKKPSSIFLVARDVRYRPVGCVAAIDRGDETAEIKRIYVKEEVPGEGYAVGMMRELHTRARDAGMHLLLLETGPKNVEAITLYERLGCVERDPFYPHLASPHSVFMEKMLVH